MTLLDSLRRACSQPLPQPEGSEIQEAIRLVTEYVQADYSNLPQGLVGKTASRPQMERLLREPPPETGLPFEQVLTQFQERIAPYSLRPHHPRFLAFIPGAPTLVSILGDWLCAGTNFFAGVWKEAPAATEVELLVLDWLKEFIGYPSSALGVLTGGGSEANLIALVTARETQPAADRARLCAYVCEQRHYSIDRAFMVMGLDRSQLRAVAVDDEGRMQVQALHHLIQEDRLQGMLPWLVVANAGATNTGAIDPLQAISDVCREEKLWLHVDAAYGWPAVLTPKGREALSGFAAADSVTLDPHKWFAQPFEAGCVLVRDGVLLPKTFQMRPEYMQDVAPNDGEVNFSDHGIALTRRFRALKIWLSIKVLGVSWFRGLVEHCVTLAEYAHLSLLRQPDVEIVNAPSLSILCFRYLLSNRETSVFHQDQHNLAICEYVRATGQAFISTTRLRGCVCLRLCFVNCRTTADDVDQVIALLNQAAQALA